MTDAAAEAGAPQFPVTPDVLFSVRLKGIWSLLRKQIVSLGSYILPKLLWRKAADRCKFYYVKHFLSNLFCIDSQGKSFFFPR